MSRQSSKALVLALVAFSSCSAGCSLVGADDEPSGPPEPAASYSALETFPWAFNRAGSSCNGQSFTIDFDNVGRAPVGVPGAPDFGYSGEDCLVVGWPLGSSGPDSFAAMVGPGEALAPRECHLAAVREATGPDFYPPRDPEAADLGIVEGAAVCVLTDQRRVVRARIDAIIGEDGTATPAVRGEATMWLPAE
ncbi:hypothetical protein AB0I53_35075 [Saccharopolyspora sp. NPDC050389]|uniref:hypothetical protein n=1 Tax=Saccharopolyspora sp. NPDC050389 TaxID=3155516 RepID=UPI0033C362A8